MVNSSLTYKIGETADRTGTYECLICKYAGVVTEVHVEKGKILPMCATCKDSDTTWHFKKSS
ncbi:MAG: hypothetical protein DMH00_04490 [Acidobacteria bacterium]|nr:MAG: hypothetical protein DMH00_04490 [Acidobacteriota bacterium]